MVIWRGFLLVYQRVYHGYIMGTLVNKHTKKRWDITMFNGKTHYFDWAIFNSYVTKYQRVLTMIHL